MEDVEKAYMAGVVDSDGSIWFGLKRHTYHYPNVTVSTQDEILVNWIQERWRGVVEASSSAYRWKSLQGGDALRTLIEDILPYLITKRQQALLVLESLDLGGGQGRPHVRERRAELAAQCSELNRELGRKYALLGARLGGFAKSKKEIESHE